MDMKRKTTCALLLLLALGTTGTQAALTATNRVMVSARAAFNIEAAFGYSASAPLGGGRTTPDGDPYNYDDGYVYPDVSGGTETWYWGYDDDTTQVVGNEVLLSQITSVVDSGMKEYDESYVNLGAELTYSRVFEVDGKYQFGMDVSIACVPLNYDDRSQVQANEVTTTDGYAFTAPNPPTGPYQGTFDGPGFLISTTPSSSTVSEAPGSSFGVYSELDGYLWSSRIGPFIEYPVTEDLMLHVSLGLSLGLVDVDASWHTDEAVPQRGGGDDSDFLSGGFISADLFWQMKEKWYVGYGLEFEYLNDWEEDFGSGRYSLDFTRTVQFNFGLLYAF
jgi:hypothetical protein